MTDKIYHERQVKELCAIHALNNLLQEKMFTKNDFDSICETLSPSKWLNPHRSFLGTGNFDVNVILSALQSKGYAGIWFDKRKNPQSINLERVKGLILNIPGPYDLGFVRFSFSRRHWFSICKIDGQYYNLDSKLAAPSPMGTAENVISYLQEELSRNDRELFIVVEESVEREGGWLSPSAMSPVEETNSELAVNSKENGDGESERT